ncbi:MAG: hypothetical protein J1F28_10160 [Oscillospiraceae bacterium]|nr:hypothetical protein [Oscillospiraceae bacterium]
MDNQRNIHELGEITYIKAITVGSINPNVPFSEKERDAQLNILNRCLNEFPKGRIIGYDKTVATYVIAEHQFVMEKTSYHIGFKRKPLWLEEGKENGK